MAIDRPGQHYQGWLDGGHAGFSQRYRQAAEQQLAHSKQQLLPLVQRLYLLDNSQTSQQQWQEGYVIRMITPAELDTAGREACSAFFEAPSILAASFLLTMSSFG